MGTRNKITKKGFFTENTSGSSDLQINLFNNNPRSVLRADANGYVSSRQTAQHVRYEFYEHSTNDPQVASSSNPVKVFVDGQTDYEDGDLKTWSTASSEFKPDHLGGVYTIAFNGELEPTSGNPVYILTFVVSGSDPSQIKGFRNQRTVAEPVRSSTDKHFVNGIFPIFVDEDMYVSGGHFTAHTDGKSITLISASLFIKEG